MRIGVGQISIGYRRKAGGGGGGGDTIPVITGVPTISGTATVGSTLTASPASVSGSPTPTRTWQWARDGVDIGGATSITYTAVVADYGVTLTVRQIETNVAGADDATSAGTVIAWEPAALFQSSEAGFWAPVTMSRCWQDTARTTPVTATGQPVASWELSTASGVIYAEQATTGKGPTYQEDTGIPYLDFDGSNDCLVVAGVNLSGTDKLTIVAGVRKDSDAAAGIICEYSANPNTNAGTFSLNVPGSGASSYGVSARVGASSGYAMTTYAAPIDNVVSVNIDIAQTTAALEFLPRVDGAIPTLTLVGSASAGTGNFGNHSIFIGQRNQASVPFNGRLTGLIIRGALTTGTDLTDAEDWATPNFP